MTVGELARSASYLALEWALPEVGKDDVLLWGATLALRGCSRDTVLTQMEIRAELIAAADYKMDEFVNGFTGLIGGAA